MVVLLGMCVWCLCCCCRCGALKMLSVYSPAKVLGSLQYRYSERQGPAEFMTILFLAGCDWRRKTRPLLVMC